MSEIEEKIESFKNNELYKNSTALHKEFQLHQFTENGNLLEGQQVRFEDSNGIVDGDPNFNKDTANPVFYNFKNGLLHSENDQPAIETKGHWEYWKEGMIEKVVSNFGEIEENWSNGVPVNIEKNLSQRRTVESNKKKLNLSRNENER